MANLIDLLTSFHGRIGRESWWLGFVIILVASIAGTMVLNPDALSLDPDVVAPPVWADTIWQLVLLVPGTAITVKRFNDRDWPFWLGYAYGVIGAVLTIALHFGFLMQPEPSAAEVVVLFLSLPVLLFAFIDNGFLRGMKGANRYGPDPLEASGHA